MKRSASISFIVAFAVVCPVFADTVVLSTGAALEGRIVEEDSERVVLQMGNSRLVIERDRIMEVRRSEMPAEAMEEPAVLPVREEYQKRLEVLDEASAQAQFDLGQWCRGRGMMDEALKHFLKATQCRPPHPRAVDECARLGVFLVKGVAYSAGELMESDLAGLTDQERAEVRERLLAYGSPLPRQKLFLVTQLSEYYEAEGRLADIERLWPQYAELMSERARAAGRQHLAQVIRSMITRLPEGRYTVLAASAGEYPADVLADGAEAEKVSVEPGTYALVRPGILAVAIHDAAWKYAQEARAQIEQARKVAATNPLKAYLENLAQVGRMVEMVEELAPGLDDLLAVDLAGARVDALRQVADACRERAGLHAPPAEYFFLRPDVGWPGIRWRRRVAGWPSTAQWVEWTSEAKKAVRFYKDAIEAHERILTASEGCADQFRGEREASRAAIREMREEANRIQRRIDEVSAALGI